MSARIPTRPALSSGVLRAHRNFAVSARRCTNIYVSDSTDPHFNLAFEDWLFRKTDPAKRILYMYRNVPSVIIGRNQNPWKEINLARLNQLDIPFVRRKSGGGTVYHDLGNTNYCVFVPRLEFDRVTNAQLVANALKRLDIPAHVNERNDICVEKFKVSGSAFKLVNQRAYHHGTMLIDAKLDHLRGVLGTKKEGMVTKGVASVPSPVKNLKEWNDQIEHDSFVDSVAREFAEQYKVDPQINRIGEAEADKNEYVRGVMDELKSWEWQYGNSPEFTHDISTDDMTISIRSRHGLITTATVSNPPTSTELWAAASELCQLLEGDRYGTLERTRAYVDHNRSETNQYNESIEKMVQWLQREM